ncbi:hypothetical protein SBA2_630037 [Acidobacteriia bacterium SbA2]|nr:hypothetical protein SBA2_630037 [Acidobacteriia bacterium SbA2]
MQRSAAKCYLFGFGDQLDPRWKESHLSSDCDTHHGSHPGAATIGAEYESTSPADALQAYMVHVVLVPFDFARKPGDGAPARRVVAPCTRDGLGTSLGGLRYGWKFGQPRRRNSGGQLPAHAFRNGRNSGNFAHDGRNLVGTVTAGGPALAGWHGRSCRCHHVKKARWTGTYTWRK